jgi:hypothetical protein
MAKALSGTTLAIRDHLDAQYWQPHWATHTPSGGTSDTQVQWPTVAEIDARFGDGASAAAVRDSDGPAAADRGWCLAVADGRVRIHWLQVG